MSEGLCLEVLGREVPLRATAAGSFAECVGASARRPRPATAFCGALHAATSGSLRLSLRARTSEPCKTPKPDQLHLPEERWRRHKSMADVIRAVRARNQPRFA